MPRSAQKKEASKVAQAYSFEIEHRLLAGEERTALSDALIQTRDGDTLDTIADPWRVFYAPQEQNGSSELVS